MNTPNETSSLKPQDSSLVRGGQGRDGAELEEETMNFMQLAMLIAGLAFFVFICTALRGCASDLRSLGGVL